MSNIFKAYDIRGVYPTELSAETARKIAAAFGTLQGGKILVAADTRRSSPELKKAVIDGLLSTGVTVVDAGTITTPATMFSVVNFGLSGAVMITASHNPPEYNGIKLFDKNGMPISYEMGLGKVEELAGSGKFSAGKGSVEAIDVGGVYVNYIAQKIKSRKKLKIIVDCMNGADSLLAPSALKKLGADIVEMRCSSNGDFPADGPDPSKPSNIEVLRKKVVEEKADAGFAYDGDGDRLAAVDETGKVIDPKFVFSMLIKNYAFEEKQMKVVCDALTSQTVHDAINSAGGASIACRVGRTFINQKLMSDGALLGGEISGHYYFRELHGGADDALFASMKIIEYMSRTGKKLSELLIGFKKYFFETTRLSIRDSEKFSFIESLRAEFRHKYKTDSLDGVRVNFGNGWALFRASNTEPKISIAFEAADEASFSEVRAFVDKIAERIPK